jgi:hypothetical protein
VQLSEWLYVVWICVTKGRGVEYSAVICFICAWLIVLTMDYVFCNMFHSRALNYVANQQH